MDIELSEDPNLGRWSINANMQVSGSCIYISSYAILANFYTVFPFDVHVCI